MGEMIQGELFEAGQYDHLFSYWRDSLKNCAADAFLFRHDIHTTGWSMAQNGDFFARALFSEGQMEKVQYKRWRRFFKRLKMWEQRKEDG